MPNEMQKANCDGAPSSKYLSGESVDDILATVDQFIAGVYRDLSLNQPHSDTIRKSNNFHIKRSSNNSSLSDISPVDATSISSLSSNDETRNIVSPSKRLNMDAAVERINRMCDAVDKNLRSVGVFMHNSGSSNSEHSLNSHITSTSSLEENVNTNLRLENPPQCTTVTSHEMESTTHSESTAAVPTQIIDLSDTQSQVFIPLENNSNNGDDDDVILVSANINPVVDLCTPGDEKGPSRQRRSAIDHSDLSRRRLQFPDVLIVDSNDEECHSTDRRKRRSQNKRKSLDVPFIKTDKKFDSDNTSADKTASGRIPYMCSVCMESCLQRQPTSTKCGHIFCKDCITQAISITHKCPLCNTRLSRNHIFRIYP